MTWVIGYRIERTWELERTEREALRAHVAEYGAGLVQARYGLAVGGVAPVVAHGETELAGVEDLDVGRLLAALTALRTLVTAGTLVIEDSEGWIGWDAVGGYAVDVDEVGSVTVDGEGLRMVSASGEAGRGVEGAAGARAVGAVAGANRATGTSAGSESRNTASGARRDDVPAWARVVGDGPVPDVAPPVPGKSACGAGGRMES